MPKERGLLSSHGPDCSALLSSSDTNERHSFRGVLFAGMKSALACPSLARRRARIIVCCKICRQLAVQNSYDPVLTEQGMVVGVVLQNRSQGGERTVLSVSRTGTRQTRERVPERRGEGYLLQPICVAIADPNLRVCCATGTRMACDGRARNAGRTRTTERGEVSKDAQERRERRRGTIWAWR